MKVTGMAKAETGCSVSSDKALDHAFRMILIMNRLGPCRCAGHAPPPGGALHVEAPSGPMLFFTRTKKRSRRLKSRSSQKKKVPPPTEDHHLGALFDACGPGTSPVFPRHRRGPR